MRFHLSLDFPQLVTTQAVVTWQTTLFKIVFIFPDWPCAHFPDVAAGTEFAQTDVFNRWVAPKPTSQVFQCLLVNIKGVFYLFFNFLTFCVLLSNSEVAE